MQPQPSRIQLGSVDTAFTKGGNRYCFADPGDARRCIKILREDRSPALKRKNSRFPKNLKPLRYFDDNQQELRVYQKIDRFIGDPAYQVIPRCFGMVQTDLGSGLSTQLVRDDDGRISVTLKQFLWQSGKTEALMAVIDAFSSIWIKLGMPSRNLLMHNVVIQCRDGHPDRLWVIDGLGWSDILPIAYWVPRLARYKAARKIARLPEAMNELIRRREQHQSYGYHGWLNNENRGD